MSVDAHPKAVAATIAWRHAGQLFVTVVVKGSFMLVPGGAARLVEPEPIARNDVPDAGGVALRTAGDLAPYAPLADVWLTGHAPAPPLGSESPHVALDLIRDGELLLHKGLDLSPEVETAPSRQLRIVGMGPLSKDWPIRRRLLGSLDPRLLEGLLIEIPNSFNWNYFQAAPLDQRIDRIRGDEELTLTGMCSEHPEFVTWLPGCRAVARLYAPMGSLRAGRPVPLTGSTFCIDVDRQHCSVVWRGYFPVSGLDALGRIHIVAGVELLGKPLVWPDPFPSEDTAMALPSATNLTRSTNAPPSQSERTIELQEAHSTHPAPRGGDTVNLSDPAVALPPPSPGGVRSPVSTSVTEPTLDLSVASQQLPQNAAMLEMPGMASIDARPPRGMTTSSRVSSAPSPTSTGTEDLSAVAQYLPRAATPFEQPRSPFHALPGALEPTLPLAPSMLHTPTGRPSLPPELVRPEPREPPDADPKGGKRGG